MAFCSYLESLAQYLLVEEMNKWIQIIYAQNLFFQKCFLHIIIIAHYYHVRELIKDPVYTRDLRTPGLKYSYFFFTFREVSSNPRSSPGTLASGTALLPLTYGFYCSSDCHCQPAGRRWECGGFKESHFIFKAGTLKSRVISSHLPVAKTCSHGHM